MRKYDIKTKDLKLIREMEIKVSLRTASESEKICVELYRRFIDLEKDVVKNPIGTKEEIDKELEEEIYNYGGMLYIGKIEK